MFELSAREHSIWIEINNEENGILEGDASVLLSLNSKDKVNYSLEEVRCFTQSETLSFTFPRWYHNPSKLFLLVVGDAECEVPSVN